MRRWLVALMVVAILATATLAGAAEGAKKKKGDKGAKAKAGKTEKAGAPQAGDAGFVPLFNGKDLTGWVGNTTGYKAVDGTMTWESGGNIFTEKEFSDFDLKLEFKLTPGANNGVGLRCDTDKNAAYAAMEIQILDDPAEKYKDIKPYQHTGSIYGVVPAKTGHLKPTGEWNKYEIIAVGPKIKVILNGVTITDADISQFYDKPTPDGKEHPGLKKTTGHIGFLGHGAVLSFRNIMIKDLAKK